MEAFDVIVCAECRAYWPADSDQPACDRSDHGHRPMTLHRHQDRVELPGGVSVTGASFDGETSYARDPAPDFGLYLDRRWQPPWPHAHLDWPDFGVPSEPEAVVTALDALLRRARAGQQVEVGCVGGHGRTGTALAGLAVRSGVPADEALAWVRTAYCGHAVETADQEDLVRQIGTSRSAGTD